MNYQDFLNSKKSRVEASGIEPGKIHPMLFDWQADIVRLMVRQGRFAAFEDPGLGKTIQQVEWTNQFYKTDSSRPCLILAPLSVAQQTIEEAKRIDVEVKFVSEPEPKGIQISNYQKLHKFVGFPYQSIACDESSILKSLIGTTRSMLIEQFTHIPYRSCWTGTPAPNDVVELLQHSEFLGIKTAREAKSQFFVHDSKNGAVDGYRLKGHAVKDFWEWVAEWAIWIRRPSDLGYSDEGYILPELTIREEIVPVEFVPQSGTKLFPDLAKGIQGANLARKQSLYARIERAREIIENSDDQWLVWCDLNLEGEGMSEALESSSFGRGAVHIKGSSSDEDRILYERLWREGEVKTLITKAGMFGFGMNWQHAHKMIYLGLGHSYEKLKQSICREWRFGQKHPVEVIIIVSEAEMSVVELVKRKMVEAENMAEGIVKAMKEKQIKKTRKHPVVSTDLPAPHLTLSPKSESTDQFEIVNCDCVNGIKGIDKETIGLSLFSPPFAKLYCYSDSPADMGNCKNDDEFFEQFNFLIPELLRVTMPGRLCVVHCQDLSTSKVNDGFIGRRRFSDMIADAFEKYGWIFASRVTIDKNPQALKNGTKVLTPTGWKEIDRLNVDDYVIAEDGLATKVLGVWPHLQRQMYRVTFSDGASVECDGQHLWNVRPHGRKYQNCIEQWLTKRTDELYGNLYTASGVARFEIPLTSPVEFYGSNLPLDSYSLGVILGDGGISQRSTIDLMVEPEIVGHMALPVGCFARRLAYGEKANGQVVRFQIGCSEWHQNPVLDGLRNLGLQGKKAWEKSVPPIYKQGRSEDRLALLQGLMDTDGCCKKNGTAYFATTSKELADDVVEIVESLGGLARIAIENPVYKYKGKILDGKTRYVVTIRILQCPFRLQRKADRWNFPKGKATRRDIRRKIVSIEPTTIEDCTCITIEKESGLFLTERCLVTHNSQAIRTKAKTLMFVQKNKDSSWSWPALADYLMIFQKPGSNSEPIKTDISNEEWIKLAHPVWYDIDESDTLNARSAREEKDEAHLCPLQLGTIRNAIRLWSNPGDLVLSPFAGIGSEGVVAVEQERRFVGFELKESYWKQAVKNLKAAVKQESLFAETGD